MNDNTGITTSFNVYALVPPRGLGFDKHHSVLLKEKSFPDRNEAEQWIQQEGKQGAVYTIIEVYNKG